MKAKQNFNKLLSGILSLVIALTVTSGSLMKVNADDTEAVAAADTYWSTESAITDYAYSFIAVGDTQKMDNCPEYLTYVYDWIVDNVEDYKVQHVFGLGDITDGNTVWEWNNARECIYKMNGKVSYSLTRGNHDGTSRFNVAFNHDIYTSQFDGVYDPYKAETTYKKVEIMGIKYLFLTLDFLPSDAELAWAGRIIKAHPNRKVIISTHGYVDSDGEILDKNKDPQLATDYFEMEKVDRDYNDGVEMWDSLISQYENIEIVLSGHMGSDLLVRQDTGVHGNVVTSFMINSQDLDDRYWASEQEPCGMVAILYFSEAGEYMGLEYYSTVKGLYYNENREFVEKVS